MSTLCSRAPINKLDNNDHRERRDSSPISNVANATSKSSLPYDTIYTTPPQNGTVPIKHGFQIPRRVSILNTTSGDENQQSPTPTRFPAFNASMVAPSPLKDEKGSPMCSIRTISPVLQQTNVQPFELGISPRCVANALTSSRNTSKNRSSRTHPLQPFSHTARKKRNKGRDSKNTSKKAKIQAQTTTKKQNEAIVVII